MNVATPPVVAAVNDLMFASRIRAAAQQSGSQIGFARSTEELMGGLAGVRRLLLDIEARWLDAPALVRRVKAEHPEVEIVAFGSHVLADQLQAVREAGADRVLARSAFVKLLPELVVA